MQKQRPEIRFPKKDGEANRPAGNTTVYIRYDVEEAIEDQIDAALYEQRKNEPTYSAEEVFKSLGI